MKTPKMPKPIESAKPTAPLHSSSGVVEETEKQKRKQGLFSTLLGSGGGTANRLGNYLGISGNSTSNTSLPNNFFNRTRPGGATVAP
jgi:hypothetical protein